ncbi:hypothetical protein [Burkholderia sp. AU32262]|uniref:hypothetical protein n=1 Tax=Burkholderia sp. AU32262 TaxID=2879630 RepID=UPI001CF51DBF|nr:hypothetical protein [Burkholderia sp. AU32262]MCA8242366.1 hypothetical protein [Burkholderia sp. AU32262]
MSEIETARSPNVRRAALSKNTSSIVMKERENNRRAAPRQSEHHLNQGPNFLGESLMKPDLRNCDGNRFAKKINNPMKMGRPMKNIEIFSLTPIIFCAPNITKNA